MAGGQCRAARKRLIWVRYELATAVDAPFLAFEDGGEGANGAGAYFTMATRARGPAHMRIKRPAISLDRMVSACYRARIEP
jgi:hypothetical protein